MYKKILIPVDGSVPSDNALQAALSFAKEVGAEVLLVHVIDDSGYLAVDEDSGILAGDLFASLRDRGREILGDGMAAAQARGLQAEQVLIDGIGDRLGDAVATAAVQRGAELIVAGTHGRRGARRFLLGSGAEEIIRLAPVPVLVTR